MNHKKRKKSVPAAGTEPIQRDPPHYAVSQYTCQRDSESYANEVSDMIEKMSKMMSRPKEEITRYFLKAFIERTSTSHNSDSIADASYKFTLIYERLLFLKSLSPIAKDAVMMIDRTLREITAQNLGIRLYATGEFEDNQTELDKTPAIQYHLRLTAVGSGRIEPKLSFSPELLEYEKQFPRSEVGKAIQAEAYRS